MAPEEVEEMIDYLLNEVFSPSAVMAGYLLTFCLDAAWKRFCQQPPHPTASATESHCLLSQIFPPHVLEAAKRYRFDEKLRNDPAECQRIYEELRVEAALLVIVCVSIPLARFRTLPRFC